MIHKDITGIAAIKIYNLYKDKTLTGSQLRKMTKQLLLEYEAEKLYDKDCVIKQLKRKAEDLYTIKQLLSK